MKKSVFFIFIIFDLLIVALICFIIFGRKDQSNKEAVSSENENLSAGKASEELRKLGIENPPDEPDKPDEPDQPSHEDPGPEIEDEPEWKTAYGEVIQDPSLMTTKYGLDFEYERGYFSTWGEEKDTFFENMIKYFICDADGNGIPELFLTGDLDIALTYDGGLKFLAEDVSYINPKTGEVIVMGHWHGAGGSNQNEWSAFSARNGEETLYIDYIAGEYTVYDSDHQGYDSVDASIYNKAYVDHIAQAISIDSFRKYRIGDKEGLDNPADPGENDRVFDYIRTVEVAADDGYVNLREGPGTEYGIIREFYNGTLLFVKEDEGKWLRVAMPSESGWVAASQVVDASYKSLSAIKESIKIDPATRSVEKKAFEAFLCNEAKVRSKEGMISLTYLLDKARNEAYENKEIVC
ncbi:MAG: SH3 domain-containing protein [Lachnospiraceae bacterium]|nr:SH3 domain-containing protein [Lachnospiraceae bacterium]